MHLICISDVETELLIVTVHQRERVLSSREVNYGMLLVHNAENIATIRVEEASVRDIFEATGAFTVACT